MEHSRCMSFRWASKGGAWGVTSVYFSFSVCGTKRNAKHWCASSTSFLLCPNILCLCSCFCFFYSQHSQQQHGATSQACETTDSVQCRLHQFPATDADEPQAQEQWPASQEHHSNHSARACALHSQHHHRALRCIYAMDVEGVAYIHSEYLEGKI